jgi:Xaa-Pro aminopeptidase
MDDIQHLLENPIPSELPFPESEYHARIANVRRGMERAGIELLLVTNLPNLYYLTGYNTIIPNRYASLILPLEGRPTMHVGHVELAAVFASGWIRDVKTYKFFEANRAIELLVELLGARGHDTKRIGVETNIQGLHAGQYLQLGQLLQQAQLVDASRIVYEARKVKSDAEIAYIRRAGEITVKGMEAAMEAIAPGRTDNDVAAAAHHRMLTLGSEYFTKWQVVASGHRTGLVHFNHKRIPLKPGDHVSLELGGSYQRYDAVMMRTAVLGKPDERTRRASDAVLGAWQLLYENIKPGRTCDEVARTAKKPLAALESEFSYSGSFGYSVGIGVPSIWGEDLIFIVEGNQEPLQKGMVFHTPLGLRVPSQFGVGFSETVVVTDTGCESLTAPSRKLLVVEIST